MHCVRRPEGRSATRVVPFHDLEMIDTLAGRMEKACMMRYAGFYGVGEYVAVDRAFSYRGMEAGPRARFINDDMLRHLYLSPDMSTNVCFNAIDELVLLSSDRATETIYTELLLIQIARVLPPGGVAFGARSPFLAGLSELGLRRFETTDIGKIGSDIFLFQRPC
jgi:hypothetical protein